MSQPKTYVGLDIGTTSVKVVVAEYANQRLSVIGTGNERSEGLSRGVIVDIDKTVAAIKGAVRQAEEKANVRIDSVVVGVPSHQINIEPCYGMVAVDNKDSREVTDTDIQNVLAAAKVRAIPAEREIISIIPEEFVVDGFENIRDPRGMIGVRLELYANMITGPRTIIHNIRLCVERAGLHVADFVVQPLANAAAALSADEREVGTIVIDMGGGQTTASVIHDNQLKFSYVDQEGGAYITKDIATVLNTSLNNAERLKREYGFAKSEHTDPDETFPVERIGKREAAQSDEHYLSEIIEARLQQILTTLKQPLDEIEAFDLPGGLVVTGGASVLPGTLELVEDVFEHEAMHYIPDQVGLRNPAFTTAYGLVLYVYRMPDIYQMTQAQQATPLNASQRANDTESDATASATAKKTAPASETTASAVENKTEDHYNDSDYPKADDKEETESFIDRIKEMFNDMFS